jgi:hypothetical protein
MWDSSVAYFVGTGERHDIVYEAAVPLGALTVV